MFSKRNNNAILTPPLSPSSILILPPYLHTIHYLGLILSFLALILFLISFTAPSMFDKQIYCIKSIDNKHKQCYPMSSGLFLSCIKNVCKQVYWNGKLHLMLARLQNMNYYNSNVSNIDEITTVKVYSELVVLNTGRLMLLFCIIIGSICITSEIICVCRDLTIKQARKYYKGIMILGASTVLLAIGAIISTIKLKEDDKLLKNSELGWVFYILCIATVLMTIASLCFYPLNLKRNTQMKPQEIKE